AGGCGGSRATEGGSVIRLISLLARGALGIACSGGRQTPSGPAPSTNGAASTGPKKNLTIAYGRAVPHIGPLEGGVAEFREIAQAGFLALDPVSNQLVPRLAEKVPSTDDGSLVFMPDGRLQTRYTLKPGIVWHDGTPLSVEDFILGYQVQLDPKFPQRSSRTAGLVQDIQALDDRTLLITWSQPNRLALRAFTNTFWAMPRHIIGPLYKPGDLDALVNSTYWTKDFVGL